MKITLLAMVMICSSLAVSAQQTVETAPGKQVVTKSILTDGAVQQKPVQTVTAKKPTAQTVTAKKPVLLQEPKKVEAIKPKTRQK